MQAALGVSTLPDPEAAGRDAAERMRARLGSAAPDLTLLLATTAHGSGLRSLVEAAGPAAGGRAVGAGVEGVLGPGFEVSDYPAALALGVSGAEAVPFLVHEAGGREAEVAEEIAARAGGAGAGDLVFLLADSQTVAMADLAARAAEALDGAVVVGSGAAPAPRSRSLLWCDGDLADDAVAGFKVVGAAPRVTLARATRTVAGPMPVTRARGHWVLGLGGRPALEVYEEALRARGPEPLPEGPPPLLAGLEVPGSGGELVVRNVVGIDRDRGAISLPEPMASGRVLALLELDAAAARSDLAECFAAASGSPASFGLYLNCRARGAALFGEPGVEAREIANAFSDLPVAGISGPFQIAPPAPGRPPALLTYAGALCLAGTG